jgi:hypothetical protein
VLVALVVIAGQGRHSQCDHLSEIVGQRLLGGVGVVDECGQCFGLVGSELEEVTEVAQAVDLGLETAPDLGIEFLHVDQRNPGEMPAV